MADSAAKAGITLKALSGTRSFSEQKNIWDNKWNNYFKNGDSIACMKKILLTGNINYNSDPAFIKLPGAYSTKEI